MSSDAYVVVPTLEDRLAQLLGAAHGLWHVMNSIREPMDQQAILFIREAMLEHVQAIRAALDKSGCDFDIACPVLYEK
ncbi:MAG TPA: hypothetical protein PKD49_05765 [Hyphomicrobium sp.]|nr:hypothetical protein [Hyphomicrobium sp.]